MKNRKQVLFVGVNDLLTLEARNLLKRAQELVQQYNAVLGAWTWDGKVMVQVNCDDGKERKYQVRSMNGIRDIRDHGYPGPKIGQKKMNEQEYERLIIINFYFLCTFGVY